MTGDYDKVRRVGPSSGRRWARIKKGDGGDGFKALQGATRLLRADSFDRGDHLPAGLDGRAALVLAPVLQRFADHILPAVPATGLSPKDNCCGRCDSRYSLYEYRWACWWPSVGVAWSSWRADEPGCACSILQARCPYCKYADE